MVTSPPTGFRWSGAGSAKCATESSRLGTVVGALHADQHSPMHSLCLPPYVPCLKACWCLLRSSVPFGARDLWSTYLNAALAAVIAHRDSRAWSDLLLLPSLVIPSPSRGGTRNQAPMPGLAERGSSRGPHQAHTCSQPTQGADGANAFNCVSRGVVLSAVRKHFPWLAPWVDTCYHFDSNLLVGTSQIPSQRGVQQEDPLEPSLFALAIHPCIVEAARVAEARYPGDLDYKAFFLDDGVLAGKAPAVQLFLSTLPSRHRIDIRTRQD